MALFIVMHGAELWTDIVLVNIGIAVNNIAVRVGKAPDVLVIVSSQPPKLAIFHVGEFTKVANQ